jgi:hypothetical protein
MTGYLHSIIPFFAPPRVPQSRYVLALNARYSSRWEPRFKNCQQITLQEILTCVNTLVWYCARPFLRPAIGRHDHNMLARYKIYRGKRPGNEPLPSGIRQDIRKHTRHCLRPEEEVVAEYLAEPTLATWKKFATEYVRNLEHRFEQDSAPFDHLADLAIENDVYIGCSCPTVKNPDVSHCHTVLALQFMNKRYSVLEVEFP